MFGYNAASGVAYRGEQYVRGAFVFNGHALPTGVETAIVASEKSGHGVIAVGGIFGTFGVPDSATYSYQFFIPVLSGATGGDITVNLNADGNVLESWIFTLSPDSRVMLTGMNFDFIPPSSVLTVSMTHDNGDGWRVVPDGFMLMEVIILS